MRKKLSLPKEVAECRTFDEVLARGLFQKLSEQEQIFVYNYFSAQEREAEEEEEAGGGGGEEAEEEEKEEDKEEEEKKEEEVEKKEEKEEAEAAVTVGISCIIL